MNIAVITGIILVFHSVSVVADLKCRNWQGFDIEHGMQFQPKSDPCQKCYCDNGFVTRCTAVACGVPPSDCKHIQRVDGSCCEYRCMDGTDFYPETGLNTTKGGDKTNASEDDMTSLGLRLVASTLTSFLILALLLFLVHRLRQRRLLLFARRRRRREHLEDMERECYIPEPFMGIEFPPYEDPPPPYTPPKPPHHGQVEDPPPYETIDRNQNRQPLNNNIINPPGGYSNMQLSNSDAQNQEHSRNIDRSSSVTARPLRNSPRSDNVSRHPIVAETSPEHEISGDAAQHLSEPENTEVSFDHENTEIKTTEPQPSEVQQPTDVESVIEQLIRNISPPPPYSSSDQLRYDYVQRLSNFRQREFLDSTSSSYSPSEEYIPSNFDVLSTSTNSTLDDLFVNGTNRHQINKCDGDNNKCRVSPGRQLSSINRSGSVPNINRVDSMTSSESRGPARISYIEPDNLSHDSSDLENELCVGAVSSSSIINKNSSVPFSPGEPYASTDISNILCHLVSPTNESPSSPNDHVLSYDQVYRILQTVRLSNLFNSVGSSSESPSSPVVSPMSYSGMRRCRRSNSFTSDASSFSVCSETGERRGSHNTIRNDAVYPETMHRNTLPMNLNFPIRSNQFKGHDNGNDNSSNTANSHSFKSNMKPSSPGCAMQSVLEDLECNVIKSTKDNVHKNSVNSQRPVKSTDNKTSVRTKDFTESPKPKDDQKLKKNNEIYAKSHQKINHGVPVRLTANAAAPSAAALAVNQTGTPPSKSPTPTDRRNCKEKPQTSNFKQYGFIDSPVAATDASGVSNTKQNEKPHAKRHSFLRNKSPQKEIHKRNNSDLGGTGADRNPHDLQQTADILPGIACGRSKKRPTTLALGKGKGYRNLFSDDEKAQSKKTRQRKSYPNDYIRFPSNDIYNNSVMTSSGGTQDSTTSPDSVQDTVMLSATSDELPSSADAFNANNLQMKPQTQCTLNGYVYDRSQPLSITHILDQNLNGDAVSMNGRNKVFSYV